MVKDRLGALIIQVIFEHMWNMLWWNPAGKMHNSKQDRNSLRIEKSLRKETLLWD